MHVGIITYQTGHLKTWHILRKLMTKSFDVTLYAFPFFPRPQEEKFFEDRPFQLIDFDIKKFCLENRIGYVEMDGWEEKDVVKFGKIGGPETPDVYLTCIAKIIPDVFIKSRMIINAHPGLLPENRGVDAFKWAIVHRWPVGISLHVIDRHIDRGTLLHRMRIPVLPTDTFRDVTDRAYEMECDLQANFDCYLKELKKNRVVSDQFPLSKKRISEELERKLEGLFLEHRRNFVRMSAEKDMIPQEIGVK